MAWAWMHWPRDGLLERTLSWFGHECTGQWMRWWHGRFHDLGMDARADRWFGSMDAGMDAMASGWGGRIDVIMGWAWMHRPMDRLAAWTASWLGHGCPGRWMSW